MRRRAWRSPPSTGGSVMRAASLLALMLSLASGAALADGRALYLEHCAACHGETRFGGLGPALLPESLGRLRKAAAVEVVRAGRAETQMRGFADRLTPAELAEVVDYIYGASETPPVWREADIEASRTLFKSAAELPERPTYSADPLNLFVVVESGDHHVTILDGDSFKPLTRFPSHFALHGGPKFSPDGRFVYFASRDGWISKYDLYGLAPVAEVRAGLNTRNLALSGDGKVVAVANYLPTTLVLLDAADLSLLRVIEVRDMHNKQASRVSAVYQAAPRGSFVAALKDVPELWEIPYGETPGKVYGGLVHSHESGHEEALAAAGRFPIRRIELSDALDDFFFDPEYRQLIGSARDGAHAMVVNLNVGREVATLALPGLPHLGSGISWMRQGHRVMATPHLKEAAISVVDMESWTLVKRIETLGPGFFLRSHEATPYAWADVFFGPNRDAIHVIDKQSLEIKATLRPAPGKTAAHVEFTRDGRYALVSIWEMDGAIVVYDAATLQEVKRIPFVKPSGKYNVYNKIHLSEGTSH
jgi:dihydro-heme d1 dehydrogenase